MVCHAHKHESLLTMWPFKKTAAVVAQPAVTLVVTEGISGYWHYHISYSDKKSRGLCDARTMHTAIPLSAWRVPFGEHFPKKPTWCDKCQQLKDNPKDRTILALNQGVER